MRSFGGESTLDRIIISGGFGFLGRHLIEYSLERYPDTQIIVITRHLYEHQYPVTVVLDDLSDSDRLSEKLLDAGGYRADAFIHAAWNGVSPQYKGDLSTQLINIQQGVCALEACSKCACRRFINVGTVAEYVKESDLISAHSRPSPGDIYGATKVAAHFILEAYAESIQQPYIKTILASTFGEYRNDDNVISYTIKSLLSGVPPAYGSLEQMWDFIYVKDAAKALWMIAELGTDGKTYGIGGGRFAPLKSYLYVIRDMINPAVPMKIGAKREQYQKIKNSCVNTFELQHDTGFVPDYSFKEGIQRTIMYFKERNTD